MYDQQITYLSTNQRRTHMVCFLCCFAVKQIKQHKSVGVGCELYTAVTRSEYECYVSRSLVDHPLVCAAAFQWQFELR